MLVTEGGYALKALADSLTGALTALLVEAAGPQGFGVDTPPREATDRGKRAVAAVRAAHGGRWNL